VRQREDSAGKYNWILHIRKPFLQGSESRIVTLAAQWVASDDFVMMDSGADVVDDLLELHEAAQVLSPARFGATEG
jgi:hypothetical protein